jgi:hypothetical protein
MIGNGFLGEDASGLYLLDDLTGRVDMWLEDDPADASGVMLRATEADPNFPVESDVRDTIVYGYLNEYIGTFYGNVPTPPTLTIVDHKDGGTITATITGADALTDNEIYISQFGQAGATGWTLIGTIVENGSLTYVLPQGLYVGKVISRFQP